MSIINLEKYPWLTDLSSPEAKVAIEQARRSYQETGATNFPHILNAEALDSCRADALAKEDAAFTTDDKHTAYLRPVDPTKDATSVYNFEMATQVASIAYDELPAESDLAAFYEHPLLRQLVAAVVGKKEIFLSQDPLGCCSINVFRPGYHHSFHFDESEFSTTLMLQEASVPKSGLFQYTPPLRRDADNLAAEAVAQTISQYDDACAAASTCFSELTTHHHQPPPPPLHTLDFRPGTLSIFAGSRSLHRVTRVEGNCSRLVAVLTFASHPGFCNTPEVQKLFWGRSATADAVVLPSN